MAHRSQKEPMSRTSKAIDASPAPLSLAQLIQTANLAEANASEEEKIKAMMLQSCWEYNPATYEKKPPPSYTCFRCGKPGHYIKNCPTKGQDKTFEPVPRIKKSTGIPRSFLMELEDPSTRGAMLTNTGKYAIPIINAEAYARGKKEKPPFLPAEPPSSSSNHDPVPEELLCLICKNITTDAVIIPCCGNSYCDECIRTALLESEEHQCPTCHRTDVSPDALVANKFLRQAVNNFRNGILYTKRVRKQLWQQPPPLVTPPAALVTNAELSSSSSLPIGSWSEEKDSQVPALPYSGSSYIHCKPQAGSSCTHSDSQPRSRSRSRSNSPLLPSPRRGKGKSRNYRCRSRSRGDRHSWSRSPVFRGRSRTQRTAPQGEGEREYFNRHAAVPLHGVKAHWGRREVYPGGQSHENHRIAGDHPEKPSGRERLGMKNPTNSREKEVKNPLGDDRANKQRFQGKRRKEEENEGFPSAELFEDAKKPKRAS